MIFTSPVTALITFVTLHLLLISGVRCSDPLLIWSEVLFPDTSILDTDTDTDTGLNGSDIDKIKLKWNVLIFLIQLIITALQREKRYWIQC